MSKVFAVVVAWNGEDQVARCLESLRQATIPVHIVVVDNASTDRTLEIVRQVCPGAAIIPLRRNLGFGRASNIGIKHAYDQGAEHVLLINQDAYVELDVVAELQRLQRANPEFGVLSPLHLGATGIDLDPLFAKHLSQCLLISRLLSDALLGGRLQDIYTVDFVNAAVWMLSRECIERVGLFNPAFPHYGEDSEYTDRVRFLGMRVGVAPGLRIFHNRNLETSKDMTVERFLMQGRGIIRYKLSRKTPGLAFNFLSAVISALLLKYPRSASLKQRMRIRAMLLAFVLLSAPVVWRRKRVAYEGDRCFFADADADKARFSSRSLE